MGLPETAESDVRRLLDERLALQLLEGACWSENSHQHHSARLRACQVEVSVRVLVDHPALSGQAIPSIRQWSLAARFRLGIELGSCRCDLQTLAGERCPQALDRWGSHSLGCSVRPLMTQRHAVFRSWAQRLSRLYGYCGIVEQCVPEFGLVWRSRSDGWGCEGAL